MLYSVKLVRFVSFDHLACMYVVSPFTMGIEMKNECMYDRKKEKKRIHQPTNQLTI